MAQHFDQLEIWKNGMTIVEEIYRLTKSFPKDELFNLTSQMRRAAVSIPSNIAEGFNRHFLGDFRRFLGFSLGSCGELETQLTLSRRLNFSAPKDVEQIQLLLIKEQRMLKSFINYLKTSNHVPRTTNSPIHTTHNALRTKD